MNANDALAVQSVNHLWKRIGRVDLLLGHFGGAGPFPQCFVDMDEESKLVSAEKLANLFIQRLAIAAQTLRARYVMPYAGQYILGGRLTALNDFRAVVSLTDASSKLAEQTNSEIVTLSPFSAFHLDGDIQGTEWKEPNELERIKYIERIGNLKFPYESLNRPAGPIASLLESGAKRVLRLYENNSITNKKNHQSHSIVIGSPIEKITLNFGEISGQISTGNSPYYENCTYIEGDAWLMNNLLRRKSNYLGFTPYHFNQAEIGSHFEWKRSGSYSQVINFMNYFQAEDGL